MNIPRNQLIPFISFKLSRSGGKGGQHVNKVSSKVELNFDLRSSPVFTEDEKRRMFTRLGGKLTAEGCIQVVCDEDRSQYKNKQQAIEKLVRLLTNALYVAPGRKATKVPKRVKEGRMDDKRRRAIKKISRKTDFI